MERNLRAHVVPAIGSRAHEKIAAAGADALLHAHQAVARRRGAPRSCPVGVGDLDSQRLRADEYVDARGRPCAGMLHDVGQRLLHDAKGHHVDRWRQLRAPRDPEPGGHAGGLDALGQESQTPEPGTAAELWIVDAAQHSDDATKVDHGVTPAVADDRQRTVGVGRAAGGDESRCSGLHDHHAHAVRDHVVQIARDPVALLGRCLCCVEVLLRAQLLGCIRQALAQPAAPGEQHPDSQRGHHGDQPGRHQVSWRVVHLRRDGPGRREAEARHQDDLPRAAARRTVTTEGVAGQNHRHRGRGQARVVRDSHEGDHADERRHRGQASASVGASRQPLPGGHTRRRPGAASHPRSPTPALPAPRPAAPPPRPCRPGRRLHERSGAWRSPRARACACPGQ